MLTTEQRLRRNLQQRQWVKRRIIAGAPMRVDAEPYVEILRKWTDAGFSTEVLAIYADMPGSFVRRLLRGDQHRIARRFADRLDVVTAKGLIEAAKDEMRVPTAGTVRRIRALAWLGHPTSVFMPFPRFHTYATGKVKSIAAGEHREVASGYRVLSQQMGTSREARVHARTKKWLSPAFWDDTNIDDPYAQPLAVG